MILNIIATFAVAIVGALIAKKLKFPIPYMLGPMFMVAIVNVGTGFLYMPTEIKIITQAITGTYIAKGIKDSDLLGFKRLFVPIVILLGSYLLFTTFMGLSLHYFFHFDFPTAFLVAVPGGVVDMSLISYDLNANPSVVSIFQSSRLIFVLSTFPIMIKTLSKNPKLKEGRHLSSKIRKESTVKINKIKIQNNKKIRILSTLIIGLIAGYLGYLTGLPAGALSFSLLVVTFLNVKTDLIDLPITFRQIAQVAAGSLIGAGINRGDLSEISGMIIPIIYVLVGYIGASFVISYLITRFSEIDFISAMFASSPGGASDMALIASEINSDAPKIAVIQVFRLVLVIILFPIYVQMLLSFLM